MADSHNHDAMIRKKASYKGPPMMVAFMRPDKAMGTRRRPEEAKTVPTDGVLRAVQMSVAELDCTIRGCTIQNVLEPTPLNTDNGWSLKSTSCIPIKLLNVLLRAEETAERLRGPEFNSWQPHDGS